MHDTATINRIIDAAKEYNPKMIRIELGELATLTSHELKESIEQATSWSVEIKEKESLIQCSCGYKGKAEIVDRGHGYCIFACPCGNKKPEVLEGGEVKLIGVG